MKTKKHRMKYRVFAFIVAVMLVFWLIPAGSLFGADIITVSNHEGQQPDSSWTSGNVAGYKEGDTINFRFDFTASAAGSGSLDVKFSKVGNKGFDFFLGSFNHYDTTGNTAEGTVTPSGGVVVDGDDWVQTLDVVFTAAGTVTVYYQLQLSDDAGQNDGASTQSQLASSAIPGDVHEPGSQTVPVPAREVLQVDDITIYKYIDDSLATTGTFGFTWSGSDGTSGTFDLGPTTYSSLLTTIIEGVEYTIGETSIEPGYAFLKTVRNGTEGFVNPIVFTATDSVDPDIYFHNYLNTGTIIVHKNIVAPDGSEVVDSTTGFTVMLDGTDQKPIAEGTDATYNDVAVGLHTITEDTAVSGYVLDSITPDEDGTTPGAQVTVTAGGTTEVWVTNKQTDATITIHKDVRAPDGSDVSDSHSFTVQKNSAGDKTIAEGTDAVYSVAPGTYTFTEVADGDYVLDSITGDDDGIASNGATVTVGSGESKELTFVNKQTDATITIHKDVRAPDDSDVSDSHSFTVKRNGADGKTIAEGTDAVYSVAPGEYTFTEDADGDYVLDSIITDNDGDPSNGATVTVGSGESKELTFVNKQTDATITIHKDVRAPDDSDVSDSHSFTVKRNGADGKTIAEGTDAVYSVAPGEYTFTEDADGDYVLDSIITDNDGDPSNGVTVTVGSGESKELTFVNKQMKATVTIVKDVRDPGGFDILDDNTFTVRVDGSDPKDFAEGSNAQYQLDPGQYVFTEDPEGGYTLMAVDPDNNALASDGTTQTLASNQNLTITFTNYQDYGSVSGTKYEDEDGSLGTTGDQTGIENWWVYLYQTTSDYTGGTLFDSMQTESDGSFSFGSVIPGYYQLTEELRTGWKNLTSWFLNFVVGPGEDVTGKDFVNFQNATIVVHKNILAPDGSEVIDPTSGFSVLIDGGDEKPVDESTNAIFVDLEPGTYTITEDDIAVGYILDSILPDESGAPGAQITVSSGATIDVYVVNKQTDATITIHKDVRAPDGSDVSDSHSFTVQKNSAGDKTIAEGTDAVYSVAPGTYTFTEVADGDYVLDSITGDDDGIASNGATVTVGSGGSKELTFVNKQTDATITIHKDVRAPDGSDVSDSHSFTVQESSAGDKTIAEGTDAVYSVAPGIYTFTEVADGDYVLDSITGDDDGIASNGATVTVGSGGSKELTFVNKQMKATVTIVKDVRDPRGFDMLDDNTFTVRVGGSDPKDFAEGSNAQYQLDPGQYVFTEDPEGGYTLMAVDPDNNALASDGTTQTLASNQNLTITFTNYQDYGSVSGTKYEDEDGSLGTTGDQTGIENWWVYLYQTTSDYTGGTLFDSMQTESDGSFSFGSVIPGYYQLTEELRTGWKNLTSWFLNFVVGPGEDVTGKDFVNFQNATIVVHKNILAPDGSEVIDPTSEFSVLIDGGDEKPVDESTNAIFVDLEPGTYTITEDDIAVGYILDSILPDESGAPGAQITVSSGATIDVYVVNKQTEATITIHKNVIGHDGLEVSDSHSFTVQKDGGENEIIAEGTDAVYTVFPGTYTFTELMEAGYTLDSITGDDDGTASNGATVEVSSGEEIELTFVNKQAPPALGSIGDYVWRDNNRNGVWDSGEFGLDDVTVYLSGPVNLVTTTDANGFYLFSGLPPGTYTVTIDEGDSDIPAGSTFTTPESYIIVLTGGVVLHADFGLMSAGPEPFLKVLALTGFDISYYIAGFLLILIGGIGSIYLIRLLRRKEE